MIRLFSIYSVLVGLLLGSCSTSNKVISDSFLQKRKFNKGFYVNNKSKKNEAPKKYEKNELVSVGIEKNAPTVLKQTVSSKTINSKPVQFKSQPHQGVFAKIAKSVKKRLLKNKKIESFAASFDKHASLADKQKTNYDKGLLIICLVFFLILVLLYLAWQFWLWSMIMGA